MKNTFFIGILLISFFVYIYIYSTNNIESFTSNNCEKSITNIDNLIKKELLNNSTKSLEEKDKIITNENITFKSQLPLINITEFKTGNTQSKTNTNIKNNNNNNNNIDISKYILKTAVPSCPKMPDMTKYILKTEIPSCPKQPNMNKYVLGIS